MCTANKNLINFIWWLDTVVFAIRVEHTHTKNHSHTHRMLFHRHYVYMMPCNTYACSCWQRTQHQKKSWEDCIRFEAATIHKNSWDAICVRTESMGASAGTDSFSVLLCSCSYDIVIIIVKSNPIIDSIFERRAQTTKNQEWKKYAHEKNI